MTDWKALALAHGIEPAAVELFGSGDALARITLGGVSFACFRWGESFRWSKPGQSLLRSARTSTAEDAVSQAVEWARAVLQAEQVADHGAGDVDALRERKLPEGGVTLDDLGRVDG